MHYDWFQHSNSTHPQYLEFQQLVKQKENTHPASYLFMTTTEEHEHEAVKVHIASSVSLLCEKRNQTTVPLTATFSPYTPTLYFKTSLKNFPYYLHMILYLHYSPWPVTFSSQQFTCTNKSFGPAPRGASTLLPAPAPPGDGGAAPSGLYVVSRRASPHAPPLARDRPRQEGLPGGKEGAAQEGGRGCPKGRGEPRPRPPPLPLPPLAPLVSPAAAADALPHPLLARPLATLPKQPIGGQLGAAPANRGPGGGRGRRDVARAAGVRRYPAGAEPAAGEEAAPPPARSRERDPPIGAGRWAGLSRWSRPMWVGLIPLAISELDKGPGFRLCRGRFRLGVRRNLFTKRVIKGCNGLPLEAVESPCPEVLKKGWMWHSVPRSKWPGSAARWTRWPHRSFPASRIPSFWGGGEGQRPCPCHRRADAAVFASCGVCGAALAPPQPRPWLPAAPWGAAVGCGAAGGSWAAVSH